MKTRYWNFGKVLLGYALIDFGLDFVEMIRQSRLNAHRRLASPDSLEDSHHRGLFAETH